MTKNPQKDKGAKIIRNYPRVTLEDALKIPFTLKDKNGGNPWPPKEVANALGVAAMTNNFFYRTSSSQGFGLTKGTRDTKQIELEDLGRSVVYAANPQAEIEKKREAFFNIKIFKDVFDHYKGSKLPETKYLSNTLESKFGLHPSLHEEFVDLFTKNSEYLSLESVGAGSGGDTLKSSKSLVDKSNDSETVVLSEAKARGASEIFVIMPFSERTQKYLPSFFTEVLNSLIIPAADVAGFTVRTARATGSDVIQSTIINALLNADLVIADLTEHNPNVLFELGVRMALEKPILLIRARGTEKIFDVDNMLRVFDYKENLWQSTLKEDIPELTKHIQAAWENRDQKTYMQILTGASSV